jgi:transcriptional regulator with XRE-family HTH domain
MSDEKQAFARRLAAAMQARGYAAKPGVLLKQFNSRYSGRSIAFSTASKWLRGMVLPEQEKLLVLAEVFGIEPHELRFGGGKNRIAQPSGAWQAVGARERQVIDAFLALTPKRRELVGELVAELSKPGGKES